jgi:hypothetical protein
MHAGIREARGDKAVRMQGFLRMELAGLEPATSGVRFGRAPHSNHTDLQDSCETLVGSSSVGMPRDRW